MQSLIAAALIASLPLVAAATEPPAPQAGPLADIPVEEWTAMASGRTLTYAIDGAPWAWERYHPGSNRVTLQFADGSCLEGVWEYAEPLYCYYWEVVGASCFRHKRLGDAILILETRNGAETGALQVMAGVSDAPVGCGDPAIS